MKVENKYESPIVGKTWKPLHTTARANELYMMSHMSCVYAWKIFLVLILFLFHLASNLSVQVYNNFSNEVRYGCMASSRSS